MSDNSNGYAKFSNGLMMAWGVVTGVSEVYSESYSMTITFPCVFKNVPNVIMSYTSTSASAFAPGWQNVKSISTTNFNTLWQQNFRWIAIG